MVQPTALDPRKREFLLDWIGEQRDPVTYDDLADRFGVHYQTARTWMLMLVEEGLVEEYPIREGNKKRYARSVSQPGQVSPVVRGPMMLKRGTTPMTFMDWAASNLNNTYISQVAYGLLYLYVRSYFANSPDHQHLRGVKIPVEIRTMILEWIDQASRDLHVIKQMLSYKEPWNEGSQLAERFGDLPVGIDLAQVIEKASFFHQQVTPSEEPPMPSPAPEEPRPMTLADTLAQMTPTGRVDEAAVQAEMQALEPLDHMRAEEQGISAGEPATIGEALGFGKLVQEHPGLHIVEDTE